MRKYISKIFIYTGGFFIKVGQKVNNKIVTIVVIDEESKSLYFGLQVDDEVKEGSLFFKKNITPDFKEFLIKELEGLE